MVMAALTWALLALGVLVAGAVAAGLLPRRWGRSGAAPRRVANSSVILSSPFVRRRVRRRRLLHALLGAIIVVALVASSILAGRPVDRTVRNEALASRDIVLCLDVSTSMLSTDVQVLDTFSTLIDTFDGERVALVAWNTTGQTMVPLTDDYDLLRDQLKTTAKVLNFQPTVFRPYTDDYVQTFRGTLLDGVEASSLIGDGLASCSLAFDAKVQDRSRSIVLASDNQVIDPHQEQIYSLTEAADLASRDHIRLFSLFGADPDAVDPFRSGKSISEAGAELRTVTQDRGGLFYEVTDSGAAGGIVKKLEAEQASELAGQSEVLVTDVPQTYAAWLVIAVVSLLVIAAWRRA